MKKRTRIIISSILSLVLLFGCIPISIFSSSALEIEPEILPSDTKITEIEEYRGENEKHFSLPDGTIEAVAYPQAVHRLDKSGDWQDIDNNISLTVSGTKRLYTTTDSRVSFAAGYTRNEDLVTLKENGYSISMSLMDNQNLSMSTETLSFTHVENSQSARKESFETLEEATRVDNRSLIAYSDVMRDTNIEYILSGNDIKENIVVKAKRDSYEYSFILSLEGLEAELQDSGEILLLNKDGETEYIIPAPYMYDSNNEYSDLVSYELLGVEKEGKYILTVIADDEWINSDGRAFPVRIDPTVKGTGVSEDTYINSSNVTTNYVWSNPLILSSTTAVLIKPKLPVIPFFATLNYATMYIRYYPPSSTTSSMSIRAKAITSNWSADSVTYNTKPTVSSSNLATATLTGNAYTTSTSPGYANFRITGAVSNYYSTGGLFYGIAIDRTSGASTFNIKSAEDTNSSFHAYVSVNYIGDKNICRMSNPVSGNYVGIDDYQNANYQRVGADIEVSPWDSSKAHQLWYFIFTGEGYYKIISVDSYLALSVPSGYENSSAKPLVQQTYTGSDNQLWSITKTTLGTCIIRPKSRPNWCMAEAISGLASGKVGQTAYGDDINFYDEWILDGNGIASLNAPLEIQQNTEWCWLAVSRMFVKHYYYNSTNISNLYTQSEVITSILGSPLNEPGTINETETVINKYLDSISQQNIDCTVLTDYVYTEASLIDLLENEDVLCIGRGQYSYNSATGKYERNGGHMALIYGYYIVNSTYLFLVRDTELGTYLLSYSQLYNGHSKVQGITWYWDRFLVYSNISSSLSTQKSYYKKINDGG